MGIADLIKKLGEKNKERKEKIRLLDEEIRLRKLVEDRMKSANERELERFIEEERQDNIKKALDRMRKKRINDINFKHNPLDIPNITNKISWEVLKEKNLFKKQKNIFVGQPNVLKGNPNLFKNKRLFRI